jgi:hypothetical protein
MFTIRRDQMNRLGAAMLERFIDGEWRRLAVRLDGRPAPARDHVQAMVEQARSLGFVGVSDVREFIALQRIASADGEAAALDALLSDRSRPAHERLAAARRWRMGSG